MPGAHSTQETLPVTVSPIAWLVCDMDVVGGSTVGAHTRELIYSSLQVPTAAIMYTAQVGHCRH